MHQQRVQLVQRHPRTPAIGQRRGAVVTAQDVLQVRRAEQGQHGQVGLAVAAVRGRVDEPAAATGPQHVARPAVPVNTAGRLARPGERADARHHLLDHSDIALSQRAVVGGAAQVGQDAALGVPARPAASRGPGRVIQRQAGDEPGPRGAEPVRTRTVQVSQVAAERGRRSRGGRPGREPGQHQGLLVPAEDFGYRDGAGLGQPAQAASFGRVGAVGMGGIGEVSGIGRPEGDLGEDFAAVGEGGSVVLPAVLGAGRAQVPHGSTGQAGQARGDRVGWHGSIRPGRGRPAARRAAG